MWRPAIVLCPNTAIQGQWVAQARSLGLSASESRDVSALTVLTYQSIAVFLTTDEDDTEPVPHLDRLHPGAREFVATLGAAGPLTLVLDECHHLLQVWGELLVEVLDDLPDVRIVALSATPPEAMSTEEALIVERLFGSMVYTASIPAFVRDGHLAPFRELVAFTEPTEMESEYVRRTALRFAQLRADLMRPDMTSTPFLEWLDQRFVRRTDDTGRSAVAWSTLVQKEPQLTDAVLRAHHAGLIERPEGATLRERHRGELSGDDWGLLLDDFVTGSLLTSDDERDEQALTALRDALPGIGYRLTRRGITRGTSPVDRVLARSASKALATAEIADVEWSERGAALRMLVICDFETASATVPEGLVGVIEPDEGSARGMLAHLVTDPVTASLRPVMVSGSRVSCARSIAPELIAWLRRTDPELDLDEAPGELAGSEALADITGRWSSRRWVPLLTQWFEEGHGQLLIGTRALLGEGWDCRGVNVLVDLSVATTSLAVTQIRGRALRTDPTDPGKVAHNWTVVCAAPEHPLGLRDYQRFVRKHQGFFSVTDDGLITDGVAHVHPDLSEFDLPDDPRQVSAAMRAIARDQARTRDLWRVGSDYRDDPVVELRVVAPRDLGSDLVGLRVGGRATRIAEADPSMGVVRMRPPWWRAVRQWLGLDATADAERERRIVTVAFARAVADGLHDVGDSPVGSDSVRVEPSSSGHYRVWLDCDDRQVTRVFAEALDEVLAPLGSPRYVIPRFVVPTPQSRSDQRRFAWAQIWRRPIEVEVVWHAVPTTSGSHRHRADAFARAWNRWVSPGTALYAGSPEGVGVLVAQRGDDPLQITTAMRTEWR